MTETNGNRARAAVTDSDTRVLVVEDNDKLRRLVVRQLSGLGYRVLQSPDAASALALLEREAVDILFTDVVMPGGMSGYDLARIARMRWPAIKLLLTSGYPDPRVTGAVEIEIPLLCKPYREEELARSLRQVLAS